MTIGYEDGLRDIVYNKSNNGFDGYSQWLNKLLFSLESYIYLSTADIDEIPPSLCYLERSYGMTKYRNFLIEFPKVFDNKNKINEYDAIKLTIDEFGLGTGNLKFEFGNLRSQTVLNKNILLGNRF